jgi:hypothetical protein
MPFRNGSFEEAGTAPGLAAHWTLRTFVARERIAGFGPPPHRGREDFERWFGWVGALVHASAAVGVFEPRREAFEAFEAGWGNDLFAFELPIGAIGLAPFGGGTVEDLETGWTARPFAAAWRDVLAVLARFGGEPLELFERGWRGSERSAWRWADVGSRAAGFDGGAPIEKFDGGDWPRITI